eukprot:TRINITY_DN1515_c0_g1_i1.p2 TRINITY_DN1515_c0_g1~~TRINITY_DN1515_c0_g1_i1.p2  ORF type:complete len:358 (+),score=-1.39 TRINITY_DN1515_c0_g1_i1:344-1417(+)
MSTNKNLTDLKLVELRELCEEYGLPTSGSKSELLERIMESKPEPRREDIHNEHRGSKTSEDKLLDLFSSVLDKLAGSRDSQCGGSLPSSITPPVFCGDVLEFPVWWEEFDTLVHSNSKVSTFYKYRYLRQSLQGRALNCLDSFSPLAEAYPDAIAYLKSRYGQTRTLIRNFVGEIIELKPMSSAEPKVLKDFLDLVSGRLYTLKGIMSKVEDPFDLLMTTILEFKLPPELKQLWEKELICQEIEFPSTESYKKWLSKEIVARDAAFPIARSSKDRLKGISSKQSSSCTTFTYSVCSFCNASNHSLKECPRFMSENPHTRWEFAKKLKLCFKCLESFHPQSKCHNKCEIGGCSKSHNT